MPRTSAKPRPCENVTGLTASASESVRARTKGLYDQRTRFFLVIGEGWGVALSVSKTRNIDAALPDLFNLDGINV